MGFDSRGIIRLRKSIRRVSRVSLRRSTPLGINRYYLAPLPLKSAAPILGNAPLWHDGFELLRSRSLAAPLRFASVHFRPQASRFGGRPEGEIGFARNQTQSAARDERSDVMDVYQIGAT